jgi:hypothetical protein
LADILGIVLFAILAAIPILGWLVSLVVSCWAQALVGGANSAPTAPDQKGDIRMTIRIAVVSLWADDIPATAHFYRDVIGLKLLPHHGDRPTSILTAAISSSCRENRHSLASPPVRFPLIAFGVNDLDTAVNKLHAHRIDSSLGHRERCEFSLGDVS